MHRLIQYFESKIAQGIDIEPKSKGSYVRLNGFIWDISHVKKTIITIPYNSSQRSMYEYLSENLNRLECKDDKYSWFSDTKNSKLKVNDKDLRLIIKSLKSIIGTDYQKTKNLT